MKKGIVSKHSDFWKGHPDVAYFKDQLYITFRESDKHTTRSTTTIQVVQDIILSAEIFTSRYSFQSNQRLNCPRLSVIGDTLWLICDEVKHGISYVDAENKEQNTQILLWKTTNGIDWIGPITTNIKGIVPDKICQTKDGYLIATHTLCPLDKKHLVQNIWHTTNLEGEWTKYPLCHDHNFNLCEASITPFQDGYLCLMRENSGLGLPAFKTFSKDGIVWEDPKKTRLFACHRPVIGTLASGKLLTTYREASFSSFFPGYWAKNTFACLTNPDSALTDFKESVILPLDHDTSRHSDSGYTGWVQKPDGNIFIVNYITNKATKSYIVWYEIFEEDF